MIRTCKKLLASLTLISLLMLPIAKADIENVSEAELYASYLTTVINFVTWPDEAEKDTFRLGILDAPLVLEELQGVQIENVRGLPVVVREVVRTTQINDIDALLVGPRSRGMLSQIDSLARSRNILLITANGNIRDNTMINLNSGESSELTFQVNSQRIEQAGLRVEDGLFAISGDELELLVEIRRQKNQEQTLTEQIERLELENERYQERERQLSERIAMLEQAIAERDEALRAQEGTLEEREMAIENQRNTLTEYLQELDQQRERILEREEQLATIRQQLRESQVILDQQQRELSEKEALLRERQAESDILSERIASNRDVLSTQEQVLRDQREQLIVQQEQLREQREAIARQLEQLESREQTISRQQDFLVYIGIGLLVAMFFATLSIVLYINKRKTADELMHTLHELHDAQDKLVESEKMAALGNLVAGVAHEVNTPLGVALTATSMLNDRRERLLETISSGQLTKENLGSFLTKADESLSLTEKNLARVARLISNFKQVAVDQMVSERREIDLREYLDEIMSTLSIELRRASIEYRILVDSQITMTTIPGAMAQVITNLTTNSIKHGFEGRTGTITLAAEKIEGDRIRLTFKDDGAGMAPEVLQQVFEPFFTTKRNEGGTGLGMPIVYNLVRQKLNGDIKVESEVERGTTFILTLPRQTPAQ